jgi:hypothetical protein
MSPDQINALYQKYLGRAANPDEISGWQSGQYGATDPASVEAQIAASGEAQAYKGGGSGGAGSGLPKDFNTGTGGSGAAGGDQISAWYQQYLGRAATPDEVQNWLNGTYGPTDPASIQQQIASSGEAQARQGGSGGSGGGGGYGGGLGGGDNPFGPWSGTYHAPTPAPLPPAPGQPGGAAWLPTPAPPTFNAPAYTTPPAFSFTEAAPTYKTPDPFTYAAFQAPTMADALNDPGYQFRLTQGTDALQNAAAAKGTLADSGTLKALIDYGQGAASQEYGNIWNRDFSGWQGGYNAALGAYNTNVTNQYDNPYKAAVAQWGTDYSHAADTYGTNVKTQYDDPYANAYQAAVAGFAPVMAGYNASVASTAAQNQAGLTGWVTNAANTQHTNDTTNSNAWNDYLLGFQDFQTRRNLGATFALQS